MTLLTGINAFGPLIEQPIHEVRQIFGTSLRVMCVRVCIEFHDFNQYLFVKPDVFPQRPTSLVLWQ